MSHRARFRVTQGGLPGLAREAQGRGLTRARRRARATREESGGWRLLQPSARLAAEAIEAVPDLLDAQARLVVDSGELCASLDFAFAGEGCREVLEQALDGCALAASD